MYICTCVCVFASNTPTTATHCSYVLYVCVCVCVCVCVRTARHCCSAHLIHAYLRVSGAVSHRQTSCTLSSSASRHIHTHTRTPPPHNHLRRFYSHSRCAHHDFVVCATAVCELVCGHHIGQRSGWRNNNRIPLHDCLSYKSLHLIQRAKHTHQSTPSHIIAGQSTTHIRARYAEQQSRSRRPRSHHLQRLCTIAVIAFTSGRKREQYSTHRPTLIILPLLTSHDHFHVHSAAHIHDTPLSDGARTLDLLRLHCPLHCDMLCRSLHSAVLAAVVPFLCIYACRVARDASVLVLSVSGVVCITSRYAERPSRHFTGSSYLSHTLSNIHTLSLSLCLFVSPVSVSCLPIHTYSPSLSRYPQPHNTITASVHVHLPMLHACSVLFAHICVCGPSGVSSILPESSHALRNRELLVCGGHLLRYLDHCVVRCIISRIYIVSHPCAYYICY